MTGKYSITAAYYAAFVLLGLTIAAEGATLLQLTKNTSSTLDQISLIFLTGSFGYLIGSYFGGKFYDRLPGHPLMGWILLLLGLASALVPVSHAIFMLLMIISLVGLARGALDVGCNTLLLWVHREKAGPFVNGLHAAFGLGAFIAPLVVQIIVSKTGSIDWVYWSFAIFTIPVSLWIFISPSPSPRAAPENHRNIPYPWFALSAMVFCFAFYVGAEAGYGSFIKSYTVLRGLGTESQGNFLNSAFWGFFTLGRLIGVWLSTRLRPITLLSIDLAGGCLSLIVILTTPGSALILWMGTILLGISLAPIFPALLALSDERMHVTGTMAGWFLVGGSLGGMFVPWLIGQLSVQVQGGFMPAIIFSCVIANIAMLLAFMKAPARLRIRNNNSIA